jgi:nucleoside-diphosphate-sugar epimerase
MSFWEGKKVLVAGGAGFIGSRLCEMLVAEGAEVSVADNLERGRIDNLRTVWSDIKFHLVDLASIDNCVQVTRGMDVVMNLAAKACGVEYSQTHHGEMMTFNALLGLNVLEAARINKVDRTLVVSTSCVYPGDADVPICEDAFTGEPEMVNEGYALGKIAMEQQAIYYAKEYGMKIAIGRPNNAYGAGDIWDGEKSHVIPALTKRVLDGEDPVLVWGSGNQSRAFVHRDDIARAFMLLTEKHAVGEPVNVGHENETTIRELIERICEIAGKSPELHFDTTKPEGAARKSLSSKRLHEVTGFVPQVSIEDGLTEMIEWFMEHYDEATTESQPELTIITPVYCEDELITFTINEIQANVTVPYEMYVVYDFDEDTTVPYVEALMPRMPELKLLKNDLGPGPINAIRAGIQAAKGKYIIPVNGDLSDEMSTINEMVSLARDGYDLIAGTRYSGGGKKFGGPYIQDAMSRVANASFRYLTNFPTADVTNSFKLYRADFLKSCPIASTGGFEFSMEMTIKARAGGAKICEIPTVWKQRKGGESRFRILAWMKNYLRWYSLGVSNSWFGTPVPGTPKDFFKGE